MSKNKIFSADELIKKLKVDKCSLNSKLEQLGIENILIISSDQHLRVKRLITYLRDNYCNTNSCSYISFFGADLNNKQSQNNFISSVTNYSLFNAENLIVVYEVDQIKSANHKLILDAVNRNNKSNVIILITTGEANKTSLSNKILPSATEIKISELKGEALEKWIARELKRLCPELQIEPEAIKYLSTSFEKDINQLIQEIERVSLLLANEKKLSIEQIREHCSNYKENTSFELIAQMANKNLYTSMNIGQSILGQGLHPLQISSFLSKSIRVLLANKISSLKTTDTKELTNFWFLKQLNSALRNFSEEDLIKVFSNLKKLDFQLKDSGLPAESNLLNSIMQISSRSFSA